jgi:hypothetical protein
MAAGSFTADITAIRERAAQLASRCDRLLARGRLIRCVGVIVPAHNEQDLLASCLASVRRAAQALRGIPVHLIVVADACRDRTVQAARRERARYCAGPGT